MAEVLEILKAYATLRSYGLEIPLLAGSMDVLLDK